MAMAPRRANANATRTLQESFRKLSSGARITRAADDAAGLAVAENLSTRAGSQRVAMRNTNDGISVVQTTEGALSEVSDLMKRMRELAVQSSSETMAHTERAYAQDEFAQLQSEIGRIRDVTEFNGSKLLDGTISGGMNVQVGVNNSVNDRIEITAGDVADSIGAVTTGLKVKSSGAAASSASLGAATGAMVLVPPPTADGISSSVFPINQSKTAIARANAINQGTATHGVTATVNPAVYTGLDPVGGGTGVAGDKIEFYGSGTTKATIDLNGLTILAGDSDQQLQNLFQTELDATFGADTFAVDTSSGSLQITAADGRSFGFVPSAGAQAIMGHPFWIGGEGGSLTLSSPEPFRHDFADTDWGFTTGAQLVDSGDVTSSDSLNVGTVSAARNAIGLLDIGLDSINSQRSTLGATQNRLNSAMNNLETSHENLLSASSRIKDTDFAYESAQMAKAQIMQQSSTAILGQANKIPQGLLRLL